jgi:hypothetical protein
MKKQQKLIEPKDFLFHTYLDVRILFVISIIFILLSLIFLIYYFASRKKYKDINRDVHYVELKPQWLYTSISFATCSIIFLLVIWFQYYKIFKFQKSKNEWIIISLFLASCAIFATDIAFILSKEPCTDPDKYLDPEGHCVCLPGLQTFSDGSCGCGLGYIRSGDSCLEGCEKDEDCPSGVCNTKTAVCCPMNTILCGDNLECCDPDNCVDDGSGGKICCADTVRICRDENNKKYCCPPGTVCDPSGGRECVPICGPSGKNICTPEQDCFVMNGKKDSLNVFKDGLSGKTEIDCKNDNDCSLYYCTPSTTCNFSATPQFLPNSTTGNVSTKVFYPCYNLDNLKDASGEIGIDQIEICIPTSNDGPYDTCLHDDGCKKENCELVNIAKANYFDADKKTRIDNAIKNFNTTQGNYKGDYCGEGRVKVVANTFSTDCKDETKAALSCATQGAFQNSKYTYFGKIDDNQYYCNSYIECEEANQNDIDKSNSDTAYFTSYQIGDNYPVQYNIYKDNFEPVTLKNNDLKSCDGVRTDDTSYTWKNTCPTKIKPAPDDVWKGGTLPGDAGMCPLNLEYIQSCGDTDNEYDSNFCNTAGQIMEYNSQSFKEVLPIGIIIANVDPKFDASGTDWRELNGDVLNQEDFPELYKLTEGIWSSGGTGLTIQLPDLQARTIFVLSKDDTKNVEPVYNQKISLNQKFGRLEPYKHYHSYVYWFTKDLCGTAQFGGGSISAPYAAEAKPHTSSEFGVKGNDAQKAFPPYLGVRWIIKVSKNYTATIPTGSIIMTYSGNEYQDNRLQDFGDDSFFLFGQTAQYCDLYKGCSDQPCATIKVGERNGDPNNNCLCHTHSYQYCDSSRESVYCMGCGHALKDVQDRVNEASDSPTGDNVAVDPTDVYPPFTKYNAYSTKQDISNNWFKNMIFFYPSITIPFGFTDLNKGQVHTPLLSKNPQIPDTGGKMSILDHKHNVNIAYGAPDMTVYSGNTNYGTDGYCKTDVAPENKNQLDVYPPSIAFYGIVWQG